MAPAVEVAGLIGGAWQLWSVRRCRSVATNKGAPTGPLAVIVPARNEVANLPALLTSLKGQLSTRDELVVVDDHSSDATAAAAVAGGARLVVAGDLPAGWTGKAWACWTGVENTAASTLLFLDADVRVLPGGLGRLVAEGRCRPGLLSVQPDHVTCRSYESLSAMFNIVAMMGVDAFTPLGDRLAPRGAFGPCMVVDRSEYLAVGGHHAVCGAIVDDVALARRFRHQGLPVRCRGGRGTISFRMYPAGLGQLVEGWSKNFATGATSARPAALALVVAWVSGCILSTAGLAHPSALSIATWGAFALQQWWMLARIGRFGWWTPLAYPVTTAFFLTVFARSVFLTAIRGEVRWRGRTFGTRGGGTGAVR